jgi:autotransporter-associated beta strand protein
MTTKLQLRALTLTLFAAMNTTQAATITWGGGSSGNNTAWGVTGTWFGVNQPSSGDDVVIGGTALGNPTTVPGATTLGGGTGLALSNSQSSNANFSVRSVTFDNSLGQFPAAGLILRNNTFVSPTGNNTLILNTSGVDAMKVIGGNVTLASRLSTNSLTVNLTYTGQSNFSVSSGNTLTIDGGNAGPLGLITGTGGITKTGQGTLSLINAGNTFTGGLTVAEGVVSVSSAGNLGSLSGAGVAVNGGTLRFTGGTANSGAGRVFSVGNATGTFDIDSTVNTRISGNVTNVSGQIGALTKNGLGTLTLNGTVNTYTGLTTVNNGLLVLGISGGSGGLASGNGLTIGASGTADFQNAGQTLGAVANANTATNALNFSNAAGTTTLASLSGGGNTRFGSNATITGGISSGTITTVGLLTANITGGTVSAGSLSASSLSGGSTTVSGVATIGTMSAGNATLNGATSSINTLTGGNLTLGSSTALTVSGGTFNGSLSGGQSLFTTGNFTFGSTSTSTFSGATSVGTGQTLVVNGNLSSASVSVTSGATLAGSGTVTGSTTIQDSGTLAPGNSPGLITFTGDLTFNHVDAKAVFEVNGTGRGTTFDAVNVSGALTYNGDLTVSFGYSPTVPPSVTYALFNFNTETGDFDTITIGGSYTASLTRAGDLWSGTDGGNTVTFSFDQTNGVLTVAAIPEPSALAALAGFGVIGLALSRRRRASATKL